jgi:hypothetical protein
MTSACNAAQVKTNTDISPPANTIRAQQLNQNFETFFNEFKQSLINRQFDKLQSYTQFPLSVRGELDDSPTLKLSEKAFKPFFTDLLAEPIYIERDSELIEYTLDELALGAMTIPEVGSTQANWQGMTFQLVQKRWALTEIITYDHLIEMHQ